MASLASRKHEKPPLNQERGLADTLLLPMVNVVLKKLSLRYGSVNEQQ